jgi:hypothetical protein
LLGFFPSPFCKVLVRIQRGEINVRKGSLNARAKEHISDIIKESNLEKGFIAISSNRRIEFSFGFPQRLRQTIKNVLLN